METIYLVYKDQKEKELVVATKDEWNSILQTNRTLPREQRRFFIKDSIKEGTQWDCIYIEVSREEYNKWHSQQEIKYRKLQAKMKYDFISMDYACSFDKSVSYGETIPNGTDFEEELASDMFMADLRDALAEWKPWANELLDYYLAGKRTQCSEILSKKYGLTLRAIQKRKIKLDEFNKKYSKIASAS